MTYCYEYEFLVLADTCFSCMDKDRCPNLKAIYNKDNKLLYARGSKTRFPECTDIPILDSMACDVCMEQASAAVSIWCSEDVTEIEAEDETEDQIIQYSSCMYGM